MANENVNTDMLQLVLEAYKLGRSESYGSKVRIDELVKCNIDKLVKVESNSKV